MPFPWKKVKSSKLTQLVNDHLNKSRDGSSLVVETGFPTSLVDLFIKNREKLKKSSKKKRGVSQSVPLNEFHDHVTVGSPTPLQCPSLMNSPSWKAASQNVKGTELEDRGGGFVALEPQTGFISAVAKMLIVVVLALTSKSLTVGITISAFLLFFMEYIGKHKPCMKAKELLTFSSCFSNPKSGGALLSETPPEEDKFSMRNCDFKCVENKDDSSVNQEITGETVESKRKSRKDKLKLIFIPKKFQTSRTANNLIKTERNGNEEHLSTGFKYSEIDSTLSAASSCIYRVVEEMPEIVEVKQTGISWILCLTILIGLIGGRAFALLLTLSWFLLMKLCLKLKTFRLTTS